MKAIDLIQRLAERPLAEVVLAKCTPDGDGYKAEPLAIMDVVRWGNKFEVMFGNDGPDPQPDKDSPGEVEWLAIEAVQNIEAIAAERCPESDRRAALMHVLDQWNKAFASLPASEPSKES